MVPDVVKSPVRFAAPNALDPVIAVRLPTGDESVMETAQFPMELKFSMTWVASATWPLVSVLGTGQAAFVGEVPSSGKAAAANTRSNLFRFINPPNLKCSESCPALPSPNSGEPAGQSLPGIKRDHRAGSEAAARWKQAYLADRRR